MIEFNKRNSRMWSIMGILPSIWSVAFSEVIIRRNDVALFTADLERYSGLQRVFNAHPEMCFNVGIAEQNMVGIAAGMAMQGVQTYMTTYAPFMSYRCADQVRHLMGNLNLNMKAIGSAAGFSAGLSGSSLLAVSDIALMRSIPNMVVLSPADCGEAIKMMIAMSKIISPCYMRFCGSVGLPIVYQEDFDYEIGKAVTLMKGESVALIATGTNMVANALKAAEQLMGDGLHCTVIDMHTIKPLDINCLTKLSEKHSLVISIEEHSILGGLGSAIAEHLSEIGSPLRLVKMGIEDKIYTMGSREFMLEQAGLTIDGIVKKVQEVLNV